MIEAGLADGQPEYIGHIGEELTRLVQPGPRSAERRKDELNFIVEVTDEQLRGYTASQIMTILGQRKHLLDVLKKEQRDDQPPPGLPLRDRKKPWVPREHEECVAKYCHNCRPSCEARSYLSLNGILNGEVQPTAAAGFGFQHIPERPIADVSIVRDIGLRAVPLPRSTILSDLFEMETWRVYTDSVNAQTDDKVILTDALMDLFLESQPAGSFPSTETRWSKMAGENVKLSVGLADQAVEDDATEEDQPLCSPPEPNPQPIAEGHREGTRPTMTEESGQGQFDEEPLGVSGGVAVLEESVQLGIPDVIMQM
ncbi:hypothetical protein GGS20DRAFT_563900 [Poronia punctata]|nr:hypothetical protein GGS20DRAFT_563900 [Poronia punctata]